MRVAFKEPRFKDPSFCDDVEHAQQQWLQAVAFARLHAATEVQPSMLQAAEADTVKAAVAQTDTAAKARAAEAAGAAVMYCASLCVERPELLALDTKGKPLAVGMEELSGETLETYIVKCTAGMASMLLMLCSICSVSVHKMTSVCMLMCTAVLVKQHV